MATHWASSLPHFDPGARMKSTLSEPEVSEEVVGQPLDTSLGEVQFLEGGELVDRRGHADGDVPHRVVGEEEPLEVGQVFEGMTVQAVYVVVANVQLLQRQGVGVGVVGSSCGW